MRTYSTRILLVACLILGFGTVLDQWDNGEWNSGEWNSSPVNLVGQESDEAGKNAKLCGIETVIFSAHTNPTTSTIHALQRSIITPSALRYQLLSVYRL
jgi:hypothetical protein